MGNFNLRLRVRELFAFGVHDGGGGSGNEFFVRKLGLDAALKAAVVLDFFLGLGDFGVDVDVVGGNLDAELKGSGPNRESALGLTPLGVGEFGDGWPCGGLGSRVCGERDLKAMFFSALKVRRATTCSSMMAKVVGS